MGALGKGVSHTDGVGRHIFIEQYWHSEAGHNLYRLPPSVRSAFKTDPA